jgi:hypothetical protein
MEASQAADRLVYSLPELITPLGAGIHDSGGLTWKEGLTRPERTWNSEGYGNGDIEMAHLPSSR